MKNNKNIVNSLMAGALIGGSLVPVNVLANDNMKEIHDTKESIYWVDAKKDGELVNSYLNGIEGLVYGISKTGTIDETGKTVEEDNPISYQQIDEAILDDYRHKLESNSVYDIKVSGRAPGYLLNDDDFTIEFPRMIEGEEGSKQFIVSDNQAYTVIPKLEIIEGDIDESSDNDKTLVITKVDENGEALTGAEFEMVKIAEPTRILPTKSILPEDTEPPEDLDVPGGDTSRSMVIPQVDSFTLNDILRSKEGLEELVDDGFTIAVDDAGHIVMGKIDEEVEVEFTEIDDTGKYRASGLKEGIYQLTETKAPKGYGLDATPHYLVVTANQYGKGVITKIITNLEEHTVRDSVNKGDYYSFDIANEESEIGDDGATHYLYPKEYDIENEKVVTPNSKDVSEVETEGGTAIVNRQEEFTYSVPVTVPKNIDKYTKLELVDKLDDRLELVDGKAIVKFGEEQQEYDIELDENGVFTVNILEEAKKSAGEDITVEFKAKVKEDAVLNTNYDEEGDNFQDLSNRDDIENTVVISFDNGTGLNVDYYPEDPIDPEKPFDPDRPTINEKPFDPEKPEESPYEPEEGHKESVIVHTGIGGFGFRKHSAGGNLVKATVTEDDKGNSISSEEIIEIEKDTPMEGVEFTLYEDKKGENVLDTAVSSADGIVEFKDILFNEIENHKGDVLEVEKTYYLKETKTIEGYRLDNKMYPVTIKAVKNDELSTDEEIKYDITMSVDGLEDGIFYNRLQSKTWGDLPITGVMTMLAGAGAVVAISFVLLKDKKEEDEE